MMSAPATSRRASVPVTENAVVVTANGPTATTDARHADLLNEIIGAERIAWDAAGGAVTGRVVPQAFGSIRGASYTFPAKLALFVTARLHERGIPAHVRGLTVPAAPNWNAVPPVARQLLGDAATAGLGGVIRSGNGVDPGDLIAELLGLYPDTRAALVARNRNESALWHRHLRSTIRGRPVAAMTDEPGGKHSPIVHVLSLQQLECCRADDIGLVIVTNVEPLLARPLTTTRADRGWSWPTHPLLRDPRVPAFGFLPSGSALSNAEELRLRSWFCRLLVPPQRTPQGGFVTDSTFTAR